jgi:hypothetical protein
MRRKMRSARLMAAAMAVSALTALYAMAASCYIGEWSRFNTDTDQSSSGHRFTSSEVTAIAAVNRGRRRFHRQQRFCQLQRNQVLGRGREIAAGGSWWLEYQAVPE